MRGTSRFGSRVARMGIGGLALVTLLGACGGGSSKSGAPTVTTPKTGASARNVLVDSVRTTAAAKSAHVSMDMTSTGMGAMGFGMTADGAVDFASGNSQITVNLTGALSGFLSGGIEERSIDGVGYVQVPDSLGRMFGGLAGGAGGSGPMGGYLGKWLKIDAGKTGASSDPLGVSGESDPTKILAYLETVSDGVDKVGSDVVRGTDTTHYHASLDLGKAVDQADVPPSVRDKLGELLKPGAKLPPVPVDVWVDSDGRVRRLQIHMDIAAFAAGFGGSGLDGLGGSGADGASPTVTMSVDFYDFGQPVDVQAPPADQVIALPDLGSLGSGLGSGLGDGLGGRVGGSLGTVPSGSST